MPSRLARIIRRSVLALVIVLVGLAGVGGAWVYWRTRACLPQLDGAVQAPGIGGRVEVLRDARGVPHLRAASLDDLFFAQGYVTAQDRLWQMDLSRRLAFGELAEIFGERALRPDIENRTLGFRQAAERAAGELDQESRALLAAYARGVNAFITTREDRLPVEFLLLRYPPRPWREADSFGIALNMFKMLNTSWDDDLMRERIRARLAPELSADLFPDHSRFDRPVADPLSEIPARPTRRPEQQAALPAGSPLVTLDSPVATSKAGLGSNNWVVSGALAASGKPLLANDPHLPHGIPSVWYMIHLKAPGLNVTGVSLPGLPTVVIGHNERIAWGVTNTFSDVQDLYVERFNFRDPKKYLHNGAWVDAEERRETIRVRNARDHTFVVKTTRHGPVISQEGDRDLALRWTALQAGGLGFALLKINQAQNWLDFTAALRRFTGPMQNFVYADVDGNIGYYAAGMVPIRRQGDGTVPVSGLTDDYDWTGYIPFEQLPHAYNPSSGILATANGRIVPDAYPYLIGKQWEAPYRTGRIFQLLEARRGFSVPDMQRLQMDIQTLEGAWFAQRIVQAGARRPPESADARYALELLRRWDGEARADSAATLVAEATRDALLERILQPKLGTDRGGYAWNMSSTFLENVLTHPWTRWLPPGDADFDATLVKSLEEGVRRIQNFVGTSDRSAWQWGKAIPLTFYHPLGRGPRWLARVFNFGPFPQAGTRATVKQTSSEIGPSMRMVVDFSDLENSVLNITLGQSGQILSPYYRDQFEVWYNGQRIPMLFGDAAVEGAAVHRLVLEPSP